MESRIDKTIERHDKGYNCAQAVACTYCDLLGYDEDMVFHMTEGFGAGMGGMDATCGALSGAVTLAGLKNSGGMECSPRTKGSTYKISKEMTKRFQETCGALACRDLKGIDTDRPAHPCEECIKDAARIVEELLFSETE
ncbi:MAG: C-GCAxxG-C-C family protein [Lachnospiraceae bacterium]|nr:C-GCAxxG-C-C family protein [Lachnospiraceae bacterium]